MENARCCVASRRPEVWHLSTCLGRPERAEAGEGEAEDARMAMILQSFVDYSNIFSYY
jgi:hypothetical protein